MLKANTSKMVLLKILEGRENEMKMTEKVQRGRLKKVEDDDSDSVTEENEDDFASAVLQKRRKRCGESIYMNCQFLQPTSNLIERFFSMAGYTQVIIDNESPPSISKNSCF